jgi:hypothetical protein
VQEVWLLRDDYARGVAGFFLVGQSHDTLPNHYELNFNLVKHHGFSLTELDNMMPYERDVYVLFVRRWIEEETERLKRQQA